MANFNRVILLGNCTRDPDVRFSASGLAITRIGLAVNNKKKVGDSYENDPMFIDCVAFGKTAETLGEYVKKGNSLLIEGRLQLQQWEDKQTGQRRSKHEVLIDRMQFLTPSTQTEREPGEESQFPTPYTNEDSVPF